MSIVCIISKKSGDVKSEHSIFDYYHCRRFRAEHYQKNIYEKDRHKRNISVFSPYSTLFNAVLSDYFKES